MALCASCPGYRSMACRLLLCTLLATAGYSEAVSEVSLRRQLDTTTAAAPAASFFDKVLTNIRNNTALLRAFLQAMPKGADIHLHLTGSVATETLINNVFNTLDSWWICPETLSLQNFPPNLNCTRCADCSDVSITNDIFSEHWRDEIFTRMPPYAAQWLLLNTTIATSGTPIDTSKQQLWDRYQLVQWLLEAWSIYNYPSLPTESYQTPAAANHFFNTFRRFRFAADLNNPGMFAELKARAISENMHYLEVMYSGVWTRPRLSRDPAVRAQLNKELLDIQASQNETALYAWMDAKYAELSSPTITPTLDFGINDYFTTLRSHLAGIDEGNSSTGFIMRIMMQTNRVVPPADVFEALTANFYGANYSIATNGPVVGINLVGSEVDPTSLRDYWLHMRFFKYYKRKFPIVNVALHAGEIVVGMVPPEQLTFHIRDAVFVGGAKRIGHGCDLPYENGWGLVLERMRADNVAIEINLSSNEFILGIEADDHPNNLYFKHGVPVVISSDDPGILRTTLTEQYMLLLKRYRSVVDYRMLKTIITNSITHSFLPTADKTRAQRWLLRAFATFEAGVVRSKLWRDVANGKH